MNVVELKALIAATAPGQPVEISETVNVTSYDRLDLNGAFVDSTADPAVAVNGHRWSIQNGRIRALYGVCIDIIGFTSLGHVSGMFLQSYPVDKEVVRCVTQCYDTLFQACELENPPNMTAPIVRVSVDGGLYNANSFQNVRFQTNGNPQAPCVVLECNIGGAWLYGNSFRDINGEICNAGLIHCKSCYGTVLDNVVAYDTHAGTGVITDDVIFFGKTPNGLNSAVTTIRNYARLSGDLAEGKYDINVAEHYSTGMLLEQISATSNRLRVKCPSSATRIEVQDFLNPWVNSYG